MNTIFPAVISLRRETTAGITSAFAGYLLVLAKVTVLNSHEMLPGFVKVLSHIKRVEMRY